MRKIIDAALTAAIALVIVSLVAYYLLAQSTPVAVSDVAFASTHRAGFSKASSNRTLKTLCSRLLNVADKEPDWTVLFGADHIAVVHLREQKNGVCRLINTLWYSIPLRDPTTACVAVCSAVDL